MKRASAGCSLTLGPRQAILLTRRSRSDRSSAAFLAKRSAGERFCAHTRAPFTDLLCRNHIALIQLVLSDNQNLELKNSTVWSSVIFPHSCERTKNGKAAPTDARALESSAIQSRVAAAP